MVAALKTDAQRLLDAEEIIRRKNAELTNQKQIIRQLQRDNDDADAIRQEIWGLAAYRPNIPTWVTRPQHTLGIRGCPITIWSDLHYGETISKAETNGLNEFDKNIAKKRLFRLYDTTSDLAFNHMGKANTKYPGIIVCLGGDMIGGYIHEELMATNDRTPQQAVNDLTDLLAAGIDNMATKFGKVYVPCVVGNHGRTSHKPRMKGRVFTNYDWSIYCNLEREFKKEKHIKFDVSNTPDVHFNSYGMRYMLTHGDSLGVKGGDGIIGAIGPIMRGSIKVGTQQAKIGMDFDVLVICHWHQMLWLPSVIVNNALKGSDEYAMVQLRAPYSRPSQALWFNHPEHGITARWEIFLEGRKKAAQTKDWVSWRE
jgi:hypothetical protein